MCSSSSSKTSKASAKLSEEQFQWQKDQAAAAASDAQSRRSALADGLGKINSQFSGFDDSYYQGLQNNYLNYANPQIEQSQLKAQTGLRSALANKGKLNSSTDATQQGELATTYGGIFRDAQTKSLDYANQQRSSIESARQNSIGQMYASESPDVGLQAASGSVGALKTGPAFEPITSLLGQAAKYATMDYNNSLWNGQSYGAFSPLFNNRQTSSATGGGKQVETKY